MFHINPKYKKDTEKPIIVKHYEVLHYDEFPILFAGLNCNGEIIIGSIIFEDDEKKVISYFHIIITIQHYNDFIKRKITYRKLMQESKALYVVNKDYNDKIKEIYYIPLEAIPADYLPLEGAYCPSFV